MGSHLTIYTAFPGIGGADCGAIAAGLTPIGPVIEIDPGVAKLYEANFGEVIVGSILDADIASIPQMDFFWASPVCKSFSSAKQDRKELQLDIDCAQKVAEILRAKSPQYFALENVRAYKGKWETDENGDRVFNPTKSYKIITDELTRQGYNWDDAILNAANYGAWVKCPIHANYAEPFLVREIDQGIADQSATMRPEDRAKFFAWDVTARLVKAIKQGTARNAACKELGQALIKREVTIMHGKEEDGLTIEATSKLALMDKNAESIELLWRESLDDPLLNQKWCITSMEIKQTTIQIIYNSLTAMEHTLLLTTQKEDYLNNCPLCKYTAVPQTRMRLICRASKGKLGPIVQTHAKEPSLFWGRWVGWYEAIADLLPTCKKTHLTEKQAIALKKKGFYGDPAMVDGSTNSYGSSITITDVNDPSFAVLASSGKKLRRAVLVDDKNSSAFNHNCRNGEEPSISVMASMSHGHTPKAVLIEGSPGGDRDNTIRQANEPSFTQKANHSGGGRTPRAIIERVGYYDLPQLREDVPSWTIKASSGCDEKGGYRSPITAIMTVPPDEEWELNELAQIKDEGKYRKAGDIENQNTAIDDYDIRALDYRCLARLQSFPDTYKWVGPMGQRLKGIGNAVPCLLAQRVIESIVPEHLRRRSPSFEIGDRVAFQMHWDSETTNHTGTVKALDGDVAQVCFDPNGEGCEEIVLSIGAIALCNTSDDLPPESKSVENLNLLERVLLHEAETEAIQFSDEEWILSQIEAIKKEGAIAPDGCSVETEAVTTGFRQAKWVSRSKTPMFISKRTGLPCKTQYIGKVDSPAHSEAVAQCDRRNRINKLKKRLPKHVPA